jgi:TM2 domain-containing membrane protein YozV
VSQEWYYSVGGDRQGPITAAELKKLAETGTLKPTDLVWKDGMGDWAQAKTIKGLFGGGGSGGATPAGSGGAAAGTAAGGSAIGRAMEKDKERAGRPSARGEEDADRPSRARRRPADDEEEDDDRPRRRPRDDEEEEDRPVRSRRRDDDEDEDDRPARRRKSRVPEDTGNTKLVAGLLGILLGALGIHKFYLGFTTAGVIMILLACTGISGIIGLIEGIIYLTKSDEDFHRTYVVEQKQWF